MKIDYFYATLAVVAWIATLLAICKLNEIKTRSGLAQATIVAEATAEQRRKDAAMSRSLDHADCGCGEFIAAAIERGPTNAE